jgi:hypothetical protein
MCNPNKTAGSAIRPAVDHKTSLLWLGVRLRRDLPRRHRLADDAAPIIARPIKPPARAGFDHDVWVTQITEADAPTA